MFTIQRRGDRRRITQLGSGAILASAAILAVSGCTSQGSSGDDEGSGEGTEVTDIAIIAPENESDHGWNQMGLAGAEAVANDLGLNLETVADAGWDNPEPVMSQLIGNGAQLLIAHASGYAEAGAQVASAEHTPTVVVDVGENVPGEVAVLSTQAQEGGYLAGVAAAMTTESDTIGIVVSADDINWWKMSAGFAEGVYSVDPDIEVLYVSIGSAAYADSAGGQSAANQLIAQGADVIFGMGDGATTGYLQAVESASTDVHYIASIGDVTDVIDPSYVLTSVLWNFDTAYADAVADVEEGSFGEEGYELTVDNGGLSLQESDQLTPEIQEAVDAAAEQIASGDVVPTAATSADEVQQAISGE